MQKNTPYQEPCKCSGSHTTNQRQCPKYIAALAQNKTNPTNIFTTPELSTQNNPISAQITKIQSVLPIAVTQPKKSYSDATTKFKQQSELMVSIPQIYFMNLLSDTIKKIAESDDLKQTLMLALSKIISLHNHHA